MFGASQKPTIDRCGVRTSVPGPRNMRMSADQFFTQRNLRTTHTFSEPRLEQPPRTIMTAVKEKLNKNYHRNLLKWTELKSQKSLRPNTLKPEQEVDPQVQSMEKEIITSLSGSLSKQINNHDTR